MAANRNGSKAIKLLQMSTASTKVEKICLSLLLVSGSLHIILPR